MSRKYANLADPHCPLCEGSGTIVVCLLCQQGFSHSHCDDTYSYRCECIKKHKDFKKREQEVENRKTRK